MSAPLNKVVIGLTHLLADTYSLYLKTQNFHWHVMGPNFHSFHKMFEEQYVKLALANDEIAERIRTLNHLAPASFTQFLKLTQLKEETFPLTANEMIQILLKDNETIIKSLKILIKISQEANDEETADLCITRSEEHEKTAWMLRSSQE
jgi:starvation-inducible DNA-binding protein